MVRQRHRTYDTQLQLKAAGLVGASAAGAIIKAVDGALAGFKREASPYIEGDLVIDVTALEIASADETYNIILQGSPDAAFGTAGNIQELVTVNIGAKGPKLSDSDKDDAVGRIIVPVCNMRNGVVYPYLRLYTHVAGMVASGINYSAFLGIHKSGA